MLPGKLSLQPPGAVGKGGGMLFEWCLHVWGWPLPFYTQAQTSNAGPCPNPEKLKIALLEAEWHVTNMMGSQLYDSPKPLASQAKITTKHSGKVKDNNRKICFEGTEGPVNFRQILNYRNLFFIFPCPQYLNQIQLFPYTGEHIHS